MIRQIARSLGRAPSTISREVARYEKYEVRYWPSLADHAAWGGLVCGMIVMTCAGGIHQLIAQQ